MATVTAIIAVIATVLPASALAALPEQLWQAPQSGAEHVGFGAGELDNPRGVAVEPSLSRKAHIYVAENNNFRVSEFTTWGTFVRSWGWGVASGAAELQTCANSIFPQAPDPSDCLRGIKGDGAGQFDRAAGLAVDSAGHVYVYDSEAHRVQKFDVSGPQVQLVLTFGGEGEGDGQFSTTSSGNFIAVAPDDTVVVGDKNRIQEFNPDGTFKGKIPVSGTVESLAIDGSGNLYVTYVGGKEVEKLTPGGALLGKYTIPGFEPGDDLGPIAIDGSGNLYLVYDPAGAALGGFFEHGRNVEPEILELDPSGKVLIGPGSGLGQSPVRPDTEQIFINGLATNPIGDLYSTNFGNISTAAYLSAFGPAPIVIEPPPIHPPEIRQQHAAAVDTTSAQVRAKINPHFWPDATYYVEYGLSDCALGGCQARTETLPLTTKSVRAFLTASATLTGLQPGTRYYYRFVAESGGGGPTRGEGEGEAGPGRSFNTFGVVAGPSTQCPNQGFRVGLSASLPDCRAYEMLSPEQKNNADVYPLGRTAHFQASADARRFSFPSFVSFADPQGAPLISRYLSTRGEGGWQTEAISPPRDLPIAALEFPILADQFKAFSEDLCTAWLWHDSEPLDPLAPAGYSNLYRLDLCGGGRPEALIDVAPPHRGGEEFFPEFEGASADGEHVVFRAEDDLDGAGPAPNSGKTRPLLYEWSRGAGLRFVCVLPNGNAISATLACSAGTINTPERLGGSQSVDGAISADGSRIYWSTSADSTGGPGKLYLREGEEAKSRKVSETVSGTATTRFWGASGDGATAFFTVADGPLAENLYAFHAEGGSSTLLASQVAGVLGASEDGGRIYFVSSKALSGEEENAGREKAQAGQPNLYLCKVDLAPCEGGAVSFVATLSAADASTGAVNLSPLNPDPGKRTSRVTPDGAHLAFMSTRALTGADNVDVASGEADAEVFLYDAASRQLRCVSCNRTGARPRGSDAATTHAGLESFWVAAQLPTWRTQNYASRLLSADGSRLFFEGTDPLVLGDTNGKADVYEWEELGHGDCVGEAGAAPRDFNPAADGCVSLISSGQSDSPTELLDATPDGSDVFILTSQSLLPRSDSGLIDVYDARVGGGYPPPAAEKPPCQGEACQSPPGAPDLVTPSSGVIGKPGNVKSPRKRRCAKGKHRVVRHGKARCVARRKSRHRRTGGRRTGSR